MWANDLALGRNHSLCDSASLTDFGACFRVNILWVDGAEVHALYDTRVEALAHLARLGWFPTPTPN